MKSFDYKRRNLTSGPHLLGMLLVLAGVVAMVSPAIYGDIVPVTKGLIVGGVALVIGVLIITSYGGVYIEFEVLRYRDYTSVCGVKMGEWEVLPKVSKVRIVSNSFSTTNTPNGISPTLSGKVTSFFILVDGISGESVLKFEYSKKEQAVTKAKLLASNLNVHMVDKTNLS